MKFMVNIEGSWVDDWGEGGSVGVLWVELDFILSCTQFIKFNLKFTKLTKNLIKIYKIIVKLLQICQKSTEIPNNPHLKFKILPNTLNNQISPNKSLSWVNKDLKKSSWFCSLTKNSH